jgi:ribokinase
VAVPRSAVVVGWIGIDRFFTSSGTVELIGGNGYNQAVALAQMGVPTIFVGAIGTDPAGQQIRKRIGKELREQALYPGASLPDGIELTGYKVPLNLTNILVRQGPTGVVELRQSGNKVTPTVRPGVAHSVTTQQVLDAMEGHDVGVLVVTGELGLGMVNEVADLGAQREIPVVCNLSPAPHDFFPGMPLPNVDTLIVSEQDARLGLPLGNMYSPNDLTSRLRKEGPKNMLVTSVRGNVAFDGPSGMGQVDAVNTPMSRYQDPVDVNDWLVARAASEIVETGGQLDVRTMMVTASYSNHANAGTPDPSTVQSTPEATSPSDFSAF